MSKPKLSDVIRLIKSNGGKCKRFTKKDREKWLASRVLGSSDSAAISGLNPYRTPYTVWAELTGLKKPDDLSNNELIEWGNILESVIAKAFAKRTGIHLVHNEYMFWHPDYPYITSTPDYFAYQDGEWGIAEMKNTGQFHAAEWVDGVPDKAQVQGNHQLLCAPGLNFVHIVGLVGGNHLSFRRFEKDIELEGILLENLKEFWQLVVDNVPPAVTDKDNEVLNGIYTRPTQEAQVEIEISKESIFADYKKISSEITTLEKQKETLKATIKDLMRENLFVKCGGYQGVWKVEPRKEKFTPASNPRVLRITQLKEEE